MKLILSLITLFTTTAMAQQSSVLPTTEVSTAKPSGKRSISETLYFPNPSSSQFSVTPEFSSYKSEGTGNYTGRKYTKQIDGQKFVITYDKGFEASDLALHLETANATYNKENAVNEVKNKYKHEGFEDLQATLKKITASENGNIIYGANISISPEKQKYAYENQSGNNYTGGYSLKPFTSVESETTFGSAGGIISLTINSNKEIVGKGPEHSTYSGGNTLEFGGFSEFHHTANLTSGLAATLDIVEAINEEHTNLSGINSKSQSDGYQNLVLSTFGKFNVSKTITVKPKLSYSTVLTKETNNISYSKNETITASIGLGLVF